LSGLSCADRDSLGCALCLGCWETVPPDRDRPGSGGSAPTENCQSGADSATWGQARWLANRFTALGVETIQKTGQSMPSVRHRLQATQSSHFSRLVSRSSFGGREGNPMSHGCQNSSWAGARGAIPPGSWRNPFTWSGTGWSAVPFASSPPAASTRRYCLRPATGNLSDSPFAEPNTVDPLDR